MKSPSRVLCVAAVLVASMVPGRSVAHADAGEAVSGAPRSAATTIAAANGFTCVLTDTGAVSCWGKSTSGQLGNGVLNGNTTTPGLVTGITTATAVTAAYIHACALLADTTVKCWGRNEFGRLGDGTTTNSATPVAVCADSACGGPLTGVSAVAAGYESTCALMSADGSVKCWGDNSDWQLGTDPASTYFSSTYPRAVPGISGAKAISLGDNHGCAILSDDTLKCWGLGSSGQLGNGSMSSAGPTAVSLVSTVKAVAGGYGHTCVIKTDNVVGCWGSNWMGQTGSGTGTMYETSLVTPQISSSSITAKALSISASNTCVITLADAIACWGGYMDGGSNTATGFGGYAGQTAKEREVLAGSSGATAIAVGDRHSCARFGTVVKCWGRNEFSTGDGAGALGNGSTTNSVSAFVTPTLLSRPSVTLAAASSVTASGATLSAAIVTSGVSTSATFQYGLSQSLAGAMTASSGTIVTDQSVTTVLSGLLPGTTYYYSLTATNALGSDQATVLSFTTRGAAPTVTTSAATSVSSTRATLNGVANANEVTSSVWFTYGLKSDLSDGTKIEYRDITGTDANDISVTASGLKDNTRYYFRIEASNSIGSSKGSILSFTSGRPVGVTVNNAAEFTNSKAVTLLVTGPTGSTQVIVSNDGGFGSGQTFDLTDNFAEISWTLVASRDERLPKTVYVRFVQRFGTQSSSYTDDIILDTTAPVMSGASGTSAPSSANNVTVQAVRSAAARGAVKLTVRAKDVNSGIGTVQVKASARGSISDVSTTNPKATSRTIRVNTTKKKLWVRVVDRAGNVSKWVAVTVK